MSLFTKFVVLPIAVVTLLMFGVVHAAEQEDDPAATLATQLADESTVRGVIGAPQKTVAVYFTEDPSTELATKVCELARSQGFVRIDKIVADVDWHTPASLCN